MSEVELCLKLANHGGPSKERNRGLTLDLETLYIDHIFSTLIDIDLLIDYKTTTVD
jgi:hypothetical protein